MNNICNTYESILVSGAGTTDLNGTYFFAGLINNSSVFTKTKSLRSWPKIIKPNSNTNWTIVSNKPFENAPYYIATEKSSTVCPPSNIVYSPIYVGISPGPFVVGLSSVPDTSNISETYIIDQPAKDELYQEILEILNLDLEDASLESVGTWSSNNALFRDYKLTFVSSITSCFLGTSFENSSFFLDLPIGGFTQNDYQIVGTTSGAILAPIDDGNPTTFYWDRSLPNRYYFDVTNYEFLNSNRFINGETLEFKNWDSSLFNVGNGYYFLEEIISDFQYRINCV